MSPVRKRGAPQEPRPVHRRPGRDRSQREFYVVVEGEVTERDYLAFLNAEFGDQARFFIHPITKRNGLKPAEVVQRAIEQLNELVRLPGGEQDVAGRRIEVWAMFDRDQHTGVPQAFAAAGQTAVQVAFSHPSFDLWLLLHFQQMTSAEGGSSDRVHAKLRSASHAYAAFARNGDKGVAGPRAQALLGREDRAARHARQLVDDRPPRDRDPSTDVWRLLHALGIV